ncbi:hypothetical protein FM104_02445 [Microbacterium esteraromaticum]|uniref:Protein ImuA n=1 Tax=Microbacterium esteraromaticum TaxID=57043 RepID=A0A1R4IIW0_9MICO|nr:hypothetical protein [Microbacterium esteraromaticum]SJN19776.1 hypothetical protein FM104_02445 [Microbacterium esteraromaticum]
MGIGTVAALSPADERAGDILRLRREIGRMQRRRSEDAVLPVDSVLQPLLPEKGLQTGAVYSVSPSPSLIFALMSAASLRGSWCAAVGMPTLGLEAAAAYGIDLSRLILVPSPGDRWLAVVSALAEVVPLIAVNPGTRVRDADAARLAARLRDRGCTMLATASPAVPAWPQSEGLISLHDPHWEGLGEGWGLLSDRTVTVTAQTRSTPRPKSLRVRLPDGLGRVETAPAEAASLPSHPRWAVA